MARRELFLYFSAVLLVLFVSVQLCSSETASKEAPSFAKGWSDWAQDKIGYGKKKEPVTSAPAGTWSSWASDKFSAFSGRTSKATEEGKEKVKAEGEAASGKAKEATGKAKEAGSEAAGKAKEAGSEGAEKLEL